MTQINEATGLTIWGINPPVYDFAWFDLWAAPMGLLNYMGYLRDRGNRVHLLDAIYEGRCQSLTYGRWKTRRQKIEKPAVFGDVARPYYRYGLSAEEMEARLAAMPPPDLILITSIMTYWYPGVYEAVRTVKKLFPKVPAVVGGVYATLCPDHALAGGADFVLSNARAARGRYIPADLYPAGPGRAVLATAQGCPRRCHYCASSILAPRFTPRSLDEILADLNGQLSCGPVSDLAFYDDALLWDRPNRFYPLCDYLEKHHPELKLHSPNGLSVDDLDAECCRRLRRAGFKTLRLSLEGVDAYTNAAGGSKTSADHYKQAVENLVAAGYEPGDIETYLLAGLPGQKTDAVLRSIEFVKSLGGRPKLCEYSPIPGTRLFEAAAAEHPVLKTEPLWHNNTVYTPYLSGAMGPDELQYLKGCLKGRAEAAI